MLLVKYRREGVMDSGFMGMGESVMDAGCCPSVSVSGNVMRAFIGQPLDIL